MAVAPVHFGAKIGLRHIHAGMETTDGIDHVDAIAADRRRIDHCGELGSAAHIGTKPDFLAELSAERTTYSWPLTGRRAVPRPN